MDGSPALLEWLLAIMTMIGLCFAGWELRANARISGQAHAREAWMRYLEHGINYPEYGSTQLAIQELGLKNLEELWIKETRETERYWWFLDIMMESCESLVNYFPENEWQNTIEYNLRLHAEALKLIWYAERQFYSENLGRLVTKVISDIEIDYHQRSPYTSSLPFSDNRPSMQEPQDRHKGG